MAAAERTDEFEAIFREYRHWFGPPVIFFGGKPIDGRRRIAAWETLPSALKCVPCPTICAPTHGDAARLLCVAGHYNRAREYIPDTLTDLRDIAAYCHARIELVAPIRAAERGRYVRRVRNRVAARRDTLAHIRRILIDADRRASDIDRELIRAALSPWF